MALLSEYFYLIEIIEIIRILKLLENYCFTVKISQKKF